MGADQLPRVIRVARGSAYALWSLSKSRRNKLCIKRAGGLPLLARLVKMKHPSVLIPVIGTLQVSTLEIEYELHRPSVTKKNGPTMAGRYKNFFEDQIMLSMSGMRLGEVLLPGDAV